MSNRKPQGLEVLKSIDNLFKKTFKKDNKALHIIGLGGVGCNILEFLYNSGFEAKYTAISDTERIYKDSAIEFINFTPPKKEVIMNGEYICISNDMNNRVKMPKSIYKRLDSDEKFVIISALDGYTGIFFTEDVANYLFKKNKMFLIISNSLFKDSKISKYAEYTRKKLISFDNLMYLELNLNESILDIVNH